MSKARTPFWTALAIGLLFVLVPACSKGTPESNPQPSQPGAGSTGPARIAGKPGDEASTPPGPQKEPAKGKARKHPFLPEVDMKARSGGVVTKIGTLTLKAVIFGTVPLAIIQENQNVHIVQEGEVIGNLSVASIKEGEVILQGAGSTLALSLYDQ